MSSASEGMSKRNLFSNPFSKAQCEGMSDATDDEETAPFLNSEMSVEEDEPIHVSRVSYEKEEYCCEFGSMRYFALCGLGGIISCGLTHTALTPLDMVKCRIQTNPDKYKSVFQAFKLTSKEEGMTGLTRGWAPTLIGYSLQGLFKFGLYEVFKVFYSDMLGEENAYVWRTSLYLSASASAEFFADIALCPMEAVKVRIQTQPGFVSTLRKAVPIVHKAEGFGGFYKGLAPLWMRQIPYTMMKFSCFERTVELLYKHVVPKPRDETTKGEQLVVTFAAGYIAGVFCAIVSHPADTVISKLNQEKGSTAIEVAKKVGMRGLWKGLVPRIIMIGTLTALQWFIYDGVKVWLKLPRPPPPVMPTGLGSMKAGADDLEKKVQAKLAEIQKKLDDKKKKVFGNQKD